MTTPGCFDYIVIMDVASAVVTGVAAELALSAPAGAVARALITSGLVAWDECECGQLALTVPQVYSSADFPMEQSAPWGTCQPPLVVANMDLSIVRCVPGVDVNGMSPSPAALTAYASDAYADLSIVRDRTVCILAGLFEIPPTGVGEIADYFVGPSVPIGPSGGCGGSQLSFKVAWFTESC